MLIQPPVQPDAPNSEIPGALIGVLGVAIGALIPIFGTEIRNFVLRRKTKNALEGKWRATWTVTDPPNHPTPGLTDDIEFTSFRRDTFKGSGQNTDFGKYNVDGRDAKLAVSLVMRGEGAQEALIGAAILAKNPLVDTLTGPWAQYTAAAIVVSGTVVMTKIK